MRKIFIIINPASGKFEPILPVLNTVFHQANVTWDVAITHGDGDVSKLCRKALRSRYDVIAVYGGDGSVMEAAQVLFRKNTPLAILPGGTANVVAKELGIPADLESATRLLTEKKLRFKRIDMGLVNNQPFLVRINIGFMASIVTDTDRSVKNKFGRGAYATTAIKNIVSGQDLKTFSIISDGKKYVEEGISLVITNAGHSGLAEVTLHPDISMEDGYLDVLLYRQLGTRGIIDIAQLQLLANKDTKTVKHWRAKNITIVNDAVTSMILDDITIERKRLKISVVPKSLYVVY